MSSKKPRQGRLFSPVGYYQGDPDAVSPENWLRDQSSGPIVFHGSESEHMPKVDAPRESAGLLSVSGYRIPPASDDRPRGSEGYASGVHVGSRQAAYERSYGLGRSYVHPVRIPSGRLEPGVVYSDDDANFSPQVNDKVVKGTAIAYENDSEDQGSISYRVMPQHLRSWSRDVMLRHESGRQVRPAHLHAAHIGSEPVINVGNNAEGRVQRFVDDHGSHPRQYQLPVDESIPAPEDSFYQFLEHSEEPVSDRTVRRTLGMTRGR